MMTRRQDVLPNSDFLVHFYLVMHLGLTSEDQVSCDSLIMVYHSVKLLVTCENMPEMLKSSSHIRFSNLSYSYLFPSLTVHVPTKSEFYSATHIIYSLPLLSTAKNHLSYFAPAVLANLKVFGDTCFSSCILLVRYYLL